MSRLTLDRQVSLAVLTRARTGADHHEDLGCSILGPPSRPVRRAHLPLKHAVQAMAPEEALRQARALVRWLETTPRYDALCVGGARRAGRRVLREEVLYPDVAKTPPRVLHLRRGELGLDVPVPRRAWATVNELFATLAAGATAAELRAFRADAVTGPVLEALREARWLVSHPAPLRPNAPGATYVGHNTTLFRGREATVLVDPYFRPASALDLPSYQPMQPRDVGHVDAVVVTHSHGDHFHLGSLLQLPRDTRFFVPHVDRESLFSTDCAARLAQAGFTRVEALRWGEVRTVGDVTVECLPFYGEQPTDGPGVYQGLFNEGATWALRTRGFSAAFFADSGHDVRGDMRRVATRVGKRAPVDVLFCGVRGFRLRPLFYGLSTLDAYLVNVPAALLTTPQQLMADPGEALDLAARLGASHLVPCADGGAPWYWREGMGPRYPGYPGRVVTGASPHDEHPDADPYPERVLEARRRADPKVLLLRPGEQLAWRRGPAVTSAPPFRWPFELPAGVQRVGR